GAPSGTRAPERTKIFVMWPSTCGMIAADPRDLRVATYSLLSSTATERATSILTGVPGGPWAWGPLRQARLAAATAMARKVLWIMGAGRDETSTAPTPT